MTPTKKEMAAYLRGFLSGYQVARNRALFTVDGRKTADGYDPSGAPGQVYAEMLMALNDRRRDALAETYGLRYGEVGAKAGQLAAD